LLWDVGVALEVVSAALTVVSTPLIVEMKGVIVATGLPLASTDTHGSRGPSLTKCSRAIRTLAALTWKEDSPARRTAGPAEAVLQKRRKANARRLLALDAYISCCSIAGRH